MSRGDDIKTLTDELSPFGSEEAKQTKELEKEFTRSNKIFKYKRKNRKNRKKRRS